MQMIALPRVFHGLRRALQLSTAFLQSTNVSAVITAGFHAMRVIDEYWGRLIFRRVLYPYGASFLLPAFVITLVKESFGYDRMKTALKT